MSVRTLSRPAKSKKTPVTITHEIVTVTPTLAAAWLDKNKINRTPKKATIDAYARDMLAGNWPLTGDGIRFLPNGDLLDGQHRLKACIQADVPFQTFVFYGVEPGARNYIDIGKSRSVRDMLAMSGVANNVVVAAVANNLLQMKRASGWRKTTKNTPAEILDMVDRHPLIQRSAHLATKCKGPPVSMLATVHYLAAEIVGKRDRVDEFLEVFRTGVPDYDGCPAHKLRERMLRTGLTMHRMAREHQWFSVVHAWNTFENGGTLEYFRVPKEASIRGLKTDDI